MLLSGLVHKYKCGGCNATYYGKTKRHFKVRIYGHLGISHQHRFLFTFTAILIQHQWLLYDILHII